MEKEPKTAVYEYTTQNGKKHIVKRQWTPIGGYAKRESIEKFINAHLPHTGSIVKLFRQYLDEHKDAPVSKASFYKYYKLINTVQDDEEHNEESDQPEPQEDHKEQPIKQSTSGDEVLDEIFID